MLNEAYDLICWLRGDAPVWYNDCNCPFMQVPLLREPSQTVRRARLYASNMKHFYSKRWRRPESSPHSVYFIVQWHICNKFSQICNIVIWCVGFINRVQRWVQFFFFLLFFLSREKAGSLHCSTVGEHQVAVFLPSLFTCCILITGAKMQSI